MKGRKYLLLYFIIDILFSMNTKMNKIAGWVVFAIALVVYYLSAERVGSLWDCGEFITGAYKLEVVHPPGAPLFLLIGRIFTLPAQWLSDDPAMISFAVNLMSGVCTAFAAAFVAWSTGFLGKLALVGRDKEPDQGEEIALAGAGLAAGLATAFCSSIWFSAVEGEVYAMSTFFTCLVMWSAIKWYALPDTAESDRWLVFSVYAAGLSIGVHLLSLLAFPMIGMLYYFKKYESRNVIGILLSAFAGVLFFAIFVQKMVVVGIPQLWANLELITVNSMGLPFHSGLIPLLLILGGLATFGFYSAHKRNNKALQMITACALMVVIGFSTIGVVVIRANANTPINMNNPDNPMSLLPYINREQYGERELLKGPWYGAQPADVEQTDRYGQVGDRYEIVDKKISYIYNSRDEGLFPRMQDSQGSRAPIYEMWRGGEQGKPSVGENIGFMLNYQVGWMYWRYFFWNFIGRQNGEQGFYPWDKKTGNWLSGITFWDEARLYDQSEMPQTMLNDKARNTYYALPFLFGLFGLLFHFRRKPNDGLALLALFVITGLGIIFYSNQPPNEPRERDYVLVGSFLTYCVWIGMGVLALYEVLKDKVKLSGPISGVIASAIVLIAPLLMLSQNFDDHTRSQITASRDYAANFLNSTEKDKGSIIFTYGDNDTYPLWYAQETENIRTDVRVTNLSLIAVDWYIEQLRRKVNNSPALNLTISTESYRGNNRNTIVIDPNGGEMSLQQALDIANQTRNGSGQSAKYYFPSRRLYIPVDKQKVLANGTVKPEDADKIVDRIYITIPEGKNYLIKDELAILDVINSNLWDRPVYFAVTCRPEKMFGLQKYMQLEGLGLRIVPIQTEATPESRQYGSVYGAGRVATDKIYKHFTEDYSWGNFDKEDVYVDRSYGPSVQSHRVTLMRGARQLMAEGDTTRAVKLVDVYFEGFPHMNFPYDYNTMYLLNIYMAAGALDNAKPHLETMAVEAADWLNFYETLDPSLMDPDNDFGFSDDYLLMRRTAQDAMRAIDDYKDEAFKKKCQDLLSPFIGNGGGTGVLRD